MPVRVLLVDDHTLVRAGLRSLLDSLDGVEVVAEGGDGRGFDVAAAGTRARHGASLGLLGMEERATLAGGRLEIRAGPSGTTVTAELPLPEGEAET